ncbi:peptidase family M49-domain-containing protein [Limtongia smithiae]|uniref:peptidase family M49-domain-containing protein n=1 Tax=Limtongia smithiae TaxID=1125753 RepID=UPI0034CE2565
MTALLRRNQGSPLITVARHLTARAILPLSRRSIPATIRIFSVSIRLQSSVSTSPNMAQFYADAKAPIAILSAKPHFEKLTSKEQFYAHYFSKAAHFGSRVVLREVSPESETIFDLILAIYKAVGGDFKAGFVGVLTEEEITQLLEYFSQFLSNLGNYKSFGDIKFIPRIPVESLEKAVESLKEAAITTCFDSVKDKIYFVTPAATTLLGYPEQSHVTGYYPASPSGAVITKSEIEAIHDAVGSAFIPENTRIVKDSDSKFTMLVAASVEDPAIKDSDVLEFSVPAISETATVTIKFGDHKREMGLIADSLEKAKGYSANPEQEAMLDAYVKSFRFGSMQEHKESQRNWIKDIGPDVETNIGFIETYRDPAGIRGEWEGLIAMVNKERTKTFGALVNGAKDFITLLPWGEDFEKDVFKAPDFTSLEVMTFAGSGIPAGINIPNYDDIRQTLGFKNVSLGNVLSAKSSNEKIPFIKAGDIELYDKLRNPAFEVQVGIHELLGHGTGKLLSETSAGVFNFDSSSPPVSPIDGEVITTYYKPGQTWGSVFGSIAGSYEECRAECVAMYLCTDKALLKIFGHTETSVEEGLAEDVTYIAYLQMARAGLVALEYWDPESKKWGQPHMQARFSIFKQFLEYGDKSFVKLIYDDAETFDDIEIEMDRSKIESHGRAAVGEYLKKLHIYKSSGDAVKGRDLYVNATTVPPELAKFRETVIRHKMPRRQFVQCNTFVKDDGKIEYREYEDTPEGMIKSFVEREV